MNTQKIIVPYEHVQADTEPIYLGLSADRQPPTEWRPAYRDTTAGGTLVIFARFDEFPTGATVWVQDRNGQRKARPIG